jgi:hypothetical protein
VGGANLIRQHWTAPKFKTKKSRRQKFLTAAWGKCLNYVPEIARNSSILTHGRSSVGLLNAVHDEVYGAFNNACAAENTNFSFTFQTTQTRGCKRSLH